jgi:hypothetical protein
LLDVSWPQSAYFEVDATLVLVLLWEVGWLLLLREANHVVSQSVGSNGTLLHNNGGNLRRVEELRLVLHLRHLLIAVLLLLQMILSTNWPDSPAVESVRIRGWMSGF